MSSTPSDAYDWLRLAEYVAAVASYLTNVLLFYLLRWYTPKNLSDYRRVLFVGCVADLTFTTTALVVQMRTCIRGDMLYASVNGINLRSLTGNFILTLTFFYVGFTFIVIGSVPWVYRYLTLCRNKAVSQRSLLLFVILALFVPCLPATASGWNIWRILNQEELTNSNPQEIPLAKLSSTATEDVVPNAVALPTTVACYAVVAFCAYSTRRYMRNLKDNDRRRPFQRQLGRLLLVQASIPLLLQVLPQLIAVAQIASSGMDNACMAWPTMLISWMPFLNAASTILLVKPFRSRLLHAVRRLRTSKTTALDVTLAQGTIRVDG
ncbi:7TM GPCR protein [Aphelenchoides avenae]|nr:7TM GPCR protein [Aphelenchus avenae]